MCNLSFSVILRWVCTVLYASQDKTNKGQSDWLNQAPPTTTSHSSDRDGASPRNNKLTHLYLLISTYYLLFGASRCLVLCHSSQPLHKRPDPNCKANRVAQLAIEPVNSEWGEMSFAPKARIDDDDDDEDPGRWNERCQIEALRYVIWHQSQLHPHN